MSGKNLELIDEMLSRPQCFDYSYQQDDYFTREIRKFIEKSNETAKGMIERLECNPELGSLIEHVPCPLTCKHYTIMAIAECGKIHMFLFNFPTQIGCGVPPWRAEVHEIKP